MDIQNATAAGPPRGLLDVIFGSDPGPQEAEADGKGFGSLMNIIKILNMKKEAEGQGADIGRTQGETMLGKSIADGDAAGMPGMNDAATGLAAGQLVPGTVNPEQKDKLDRLSMLGISAAMLGQVPGQQAGALAPLQPGQVNQVLQAKGLPALSPQEMKLLRDVNGKIAQVNDPGASGAEVPLGLVAGTGALDPKALLPKAAVSDGGQALDPQLQKAMAGKGLDPRKLKATEATVVGTPEKLLTTETYLQMHGNANAAVANAAAKPQPGKDVAAKGGQPAGTDSSVAAKAESTLTAIAVAGTSQKGPGLGSRKGDEGSDLPGGAGQAKLDAASAAGGFGGALALRSDAMKRDVYLPGPDKPEQRANMLLAEVGSEVAFHAHKGGGEMRLVIHPDDLGEVKLKIGTKNGKVEVQISAENEDVARMIRGGSKELEASLKDQNLSLARFEVTVSDATSVVSTDTRSGLNEQFLSQNQQQPQHGGNGFLQGGMADDGRGSRWGAEQGGRQGGAYSPMAEESGRAAARSAPPVPRGATRATTSGSRRLDVVA